MKKINYIDSVRHPIITEKATILSEQNKTVFKVHEKANKKIIKKNIEKLFKVNVIKVNIINKKSNYNSKLLMTNCTLCNSKEKLETHHINFQKDTNELGFINKENIFKKMIINKITFFIFKKRFQF